MGRILPCRSCCSPVPAVWGRRCRERGGSIHPQLWGANGVSFPPPAYKTVCGVNGPLVVLDNVKVGARLPAGDKGTARRCHFGLRGDHRAVPCLALGFPGGEGGILVAPLACPCSRSRGWVHSGGLIPAWPG